MNKYLFSIIGSLILFAQKAYCAAETAAPALEKSLKDTSQEPNFMSVIFALLFVVALIYVTGIIYSKLNVVGAKTVKEQLKNYDLSRVAVISTTQLGQGKNLHVIEINNERFLIGATANSINLIKDLGKTESKELESSALPIEDENYYGNIDEIKENEDVNEEFIKDEEAENVKKFDVHKKYLKN